MPHYKNGRIAQVGDYVVGTGYNLKNSDGQPLVFAGQVLFVNPDTDTCNITVLVQLAVPLAQALSGTTGLVDRASNADGTFIRPIFEYGACKDFLHAEDALNAGSPRIISPEPVPVTPPTA